MGSMSVSFCRHLWVFGRTCSRIRAAEYVCVCVCVCVWVCVCVCVCVCVHARARVHFRVSAQGCVSRSTCSRVRQDFAVDVVEFHKPGVSQRLTFEQLEAWVEPPHKQQLSHLHLTSDGRTSISVDCSRTPIGNPTADAAAYVDRLSFATCCLLMLIAYRLLLAACLC